MNKDFHLYHIISAYRDDRLSKNSRKQFESAMNADPDLKLLIEDFPLIEEALEAATHVEVVETISQEEARQILKRIYDSGFSLSSTNKTKVIPIRKRRWLKYASVIVLVIAISGYPLFNTFYKQTQGQLYATYYEAYPVTELFGTRSLELDNILVLREEAYRFYDSQNFEKFIQQLSELPPEYPNHLNDGFYLGIAYLETKRWKKAVTVLEQIINTNSEYAAEANWFLGMAYLGLRECEKAKSAFKLVQNNGPDNRKKASIILKRIKC